MTVYGMDPQARRQGGLGTAVLAGAGVAVAGAVVWGLIAYLTKYELSLMAVFLGAAVGAVIFRASGQIRNPRWRRRPGCWPSSAVPWVASLPRSWSCWATAFPAA
jgi:hypothetical protein